MAGEPASALRRPTGMRRALLLAPLAVVMITACGSSDDDDAVSDSAPVSTSTPVTTTADGPASSPATTTPAAGSLRPSDSTISRVPGPSTPGAGSGPRGTADELAAVADLAQRQGVDPAAITVVSTDEVTWRDGSMGCPQPDMMYTQALVPGIRVILELDGVRYEYHSGGARSMFLCDDPQQPAEG